MTMRAMPLHHEPRPAPRWRDPELRPLLLESLRKEVEAENVSQLHKWGVQTHSPAEWAVIAAEEFGELMKELCEANFSPYDVERTVRIHTETIQTITLLLKIYLMAEEL